MTDSSTPETTQKYALSYPKTLQKLNLILPKCPQERLNHLFCALGDLGRTLKDLNEFQNNKSENNLESNNSGSSKYQQSLACQEKAILVQIVFTSLELNDFDLAITVMNHIVKTLKCDTNAFKKTLYSLLGRIYLQLGELQEGEKFIRVAHDSFQNERFQDFQGLLDEGILAFGQGQFQKAYELFQKASLINPSDLVVRNNCAVCLVYLCRAKESICILAEAVNENANTNIQTYLQLNLNKLKMLTSSSRTALPVLK